MKIVSNKFLIVVLLCIVCFGVEAQELSEPMAELMRICVDLSHGLGNYSDQNISDANESFRQFRMKNHIGALQASNITQDEITGGEGEKVVFLPEFFDRILEHDQAYEMSFALKKQFERNFGNERVVKGAKRKFDIYQKDFFIGPGDSISFDVDCLGTAFEIIAVASPGGLFNMNVYDYSKQEHWKDDDKERTGNETRFRHIEGKKNSKYNITLENRTNGSYTIAVFCKL